MQTTLLVRDPEIIDNDLCATKDLGSTSPTGPPYLDNTVIGKGGIVDGAQEFVAPWIKDSAHRVVRLKSLR